MHTARTGCSGGCPRAYLSFLSTTRFALSCAKGRELIQPSPKTGDQRAVISTTLEDTRVPASSMGQGQDEKIFLCQPQF